MDIYCMNALKNMSCRYVSPFVVLSNHEKTSNLKSATFFFTYLRYHLSRDIAAAHILAVEKSSMEGRYCCCNQVSSYGRVVAQQYQNLQYHTRLEYFLHSLLECYPLYRLVA